MGAVAGPPTPKVTKGNPAAAALICRGSRVWGDACVDTLGEPGYHQAGYSYARAVALYATGVNTSSADSLARLAVNLSSNDAYLAPVIRAELGAVRAWRVQGDAAKAIEGFQTSVEAVDAVRYTEPPR